MRRRRIVDELSLCDSWLREQDPYFANQYDSEVFDFFITLIGFVRVFATITVMRSASCVVHALVQHVCKVKALASSKKSMKDAFRKNEENIGFK